MMSTFQMRHTSVEAKQFDGTIDSAKAIQDLLGDEAEVVFVLAVRRNAATAQVTMNSEIISLPSGDWIVKIGARLSALKPEAFAELYAPPAG